MKNIITGIVAACLMVAMATAALAGPKPPRGLSPEAAQELQAKEVDKYLGQFTPVSSTDVGDGWTKHQFDLEEGAGPVCIAGTSYSAFTRAGNPAKLLIFQQGGGACWQDFYQCNIFAEAQEPPTAPVGIWDFDAKNKDNPFADYSVVYMPYCDGSVFSGDNDVVDPAWQAFIEAALDLPPGFGPPTRLHRGLRNQSAGMDLAKAVFPNASRITVAGTSAGGVGVAGFAPFLARLLYGNQVDLTVFNDAGPVVANLNAVGDVAARANDWQVARFYPDSCTGCDPLGQPTELIQWRLDNDSTVREAFYSTDGDFVARFFNKVPTQSAYRALILMEHEKLNANHPDRYKTFIVSGDDSHTALQLPLFQTQDANGVLLSDWTGHFISPRKPFWTNLIEEFVPVP